MRRTLALDTTANFGSLALLEDEVVLEELPVHAPEGFSQALFGAMERFLDRHGWSIGHVDCFAAASGPGSFTGVRVGLTAVKGLAEATGRTAIGVSNLQALASYGTGAVRGSLMDARRGEIYAGLYDAELRPILNEEVMTFQNWLEWLPRGLTDIICPDFAAFRASYPLPLQVQEQRTIAGAIGRIAWARLESGETVDTAAIDANYVRRSDAELFWKDR